MRKKKVSEINIKSKKTINSKWLSNIEKDPRPKFLYVANSRGGHNFIKDNILSWLGHEDLKSSGYEYRNLENYKLKRFTNGITPLSTELYNESIKILSIRDLLNWYTSYFYLFKKIIHINGFILEKVDEYSCKVINPINGKFKLIKYDNPKIYKTYKNKYSDKKFKLDRQMKIGLDSWLTYAKEFNEETNILKDFVHIFYDRFFESKEYRELICSQLGGTYNEDKLNIVPPQGNYSTFDSHDYQNAAQDMTDVLERYKNWKEEDKIYLNELFKHDAFQYYLEHFEVNEDKQSFINENNV